MEKHELQDKNPTPKISSASNHGTFTNEIQKYKLLRIYYKKYYKLPANIP